MDLSSRSPEELRVIAEDGVRLLQQLRSVAPNNSPSPTSLQVQLSGLNWIWQRERDTASGSGSGIIMNKSGIGKAVILSLFSMGSEVPVGDGRQGQACNQTPTEDRVLSHGTLAIWKEDLKNSCPSESVLTFHGHTGREHARLLPASKVAEYDVVLTTYDVMRTACIPDVKVRMAEPEHTVARCQLFSIEWHRVILDEGLKIKNLDGNYCISACALHARHRWILSRAPLPKKAKEMYALLKFLRLQPFCDQEVWEYWTAGTEEELGGKFELITKSIVLGRTAGDGGNTRDE